MLELGIREEGGMRQRCARSFERVSAEQGTSVGGHGGQGERRFMHSYAKLQCAQLSSGREHVGVHLALGRCHCRAFCRWSCRASHVGTEFSFVVSRICCLSVLPNPCLLISSTPGNLY